LLDELLTENQTLRRVLSLGKETEPIEQIIVRLERQAQEAAYKDDTRKRIEWETEVERIRVEVASQLQQRYNERV
jgi:hypothetical protein